MNNYNYIILRNGFGNRMFDVIIALYVYYKTKKKLCGIIRHTKHNSENIFDLFPFLKKI